MKVKKSDLHAPMGAAESKQDRNGVSPHYTEHPEKLSRAPLPGGKGEYFTGGGDAIGAVPNGTKEDRRVPSNPTGSDGFRERPDKVATHGKADHSGARGRNYHEEQVRDAQPGKRTDLVPENKRSGAGDDRKTISNQSSFGGKPWKV